MGDPRGFLKYKRQTPERRPVEVRLRDWDEMYQPLAEPELRNQASRCMDCGVPFCQSKFGCPVENFIPDWNELVQQGRWREALENLHSTNNFPEFTGRLCPAPCESACVLGIHDQPVAIRNIEWSVIDRGFDEGWVQPQPPRVSTGKRVAVVGSGPAGLAAAQELRRAGHQVTVFEKQDRIGGLLRYGIPDFKMEKSILERRLGQLAAEGIEFKTGVEIGKTYSIPELRRDYDAICLAIGAETPRELPVPGRELRGIHFAMDYLTQQNRLLAGEPINESERIDARGKRVVIIGGGDTGSDCLGTAHRQGCLEVHQFELMPTPPEQRAPDTPWPLWPMQLRSSHSHEEGGARHWSISTTGFTGQNGQVTHLNAQKVVFEGGRFVAIPESGFSMPVDLVILAMGFSGVRRAPWIEELRLKYDTRGNIAGDSDFQTNLPGVFVAGDARRGASLIVWAIAEGRKMAHSVDRWLSQLHIEAGKPPAALAAP